jgi:hypothetical protein
MRMAATGQDTLNQGATNTALNYPLQIQVGNNHPLKASLSQGTLVTTSDSLVTVPIYDPASLPSTPGAGAPVTIHWIPGSSSSTKCIPQGAAPKHARSRRPSSTSLAVAAVRRTHRYTAAVLPRFPSGSFTDRWH